MVAQMKSITQALHRFAMLGSAGHRSQIDGIAQAKDQVPAALPSSTGVRTAR